MKESCEREETRQVEIRESLKRNGATLVNVTGGMTTLLEKMEEVRISDYYYLTDILLRS